MLKKLLGIALLVAASWACAQSTDDSPVDNKSTYHISDAIDLVSATDTKYDKSRIIIKMVFPRLNNSDDSESMNKFDDSDTSKADATPPSSTGLETDAFNQLITSIINEEITYFKQKVGDAADFQKTVDKTKIRNRMTIDYNSAVINLEEQPLISIRFIIQGYVTGMAHPYHRYRVLNFDVDAGKEIQLAELFKSDSNYLEFIADFAHKELGKQFKDDSMLANGTSPTSQNFANWNFNLNGLRFTFDEATVAPAVNGMQSVLIPYSEMKKLIDPESVLGKCLAHRTRCMRDHLLTGGFIDEAANTRNSRLNPVLG